jgi:hypothetical protein
MGGEHVMLVVEGPDGAGKTTLVNQLSELLKWPVAPRVVSERAEAMTDLKQWTEQNVGAGFQQLIFDRHRLISEPIYGTVLRSEAERGFDDVDWLALMYSKFYRCQPIVIYCMPKFLTVWSNVQNDPHNTVPGPHIRKIYRAYAARAALDQVQGVAEVYDYELSLENEPWVLRYVDIQLRRRGAR